MGYLFFFASGTSALIYETVWMRLLGLVFGNTTFAVSTVLAAYMAGLGLGSYALGAVADRTRKPLFVYGVLELGISAYAGLTFIFVGTIQSLYTAFAQTLHAQSFFLIILIRFLLSSLVLFIPTFLMGATLPVLAKFYIRRPSAIGAQTAMLYGLNTAGAVAGTLLCGFWLLPGFGLHAALAIAVTLNAGIGILACLASWKIKNPACRFSVEIPAPEIFTEHGSEAPRSRNTRLLAAGLFLSGACAMLYEVAWTRVLSTLIGSSVYAFTLMLATFLVGLAAGSGVYQRILSRRKTNLREWGWLQAMIALTALASLPFYERTPLFMLRLFPLIADHPFLLYVFHFAVYSALMFVPAFGFGAIFPVSVALYTTDTSFAGRGVGKLYLSNTCGNMVGSIAAGFFLIPAFGIHRTLLTSIFLGGTLGIGIVWMHNSRNVRSLLACLFVTLLFTAGLWKSQKGWDPRLLTSGLHIRPHNWVSQTSVDVLATLDDNEILFYREGLNNIVSVAQAGEHRYLKVNGKTDASNGLDMSTQLLSGHLPHLLHADPKRTLIIGFGSGTTLAASLAYPIDHADMVELEPAVLEAAPFFDAINRKAYKDPRVRLIPNDGRNHLLMEQGRYDVIISEPSNPWMAGTSYLFTVEFYDLVRRHLAPGGILCQWLQAYSIAPDDFQMVVASVHAMLPYVTLWQSLPGDILIIASQNPIPFELDQIEDRIKASQNTQHDMDLLQLHGAAGLLSYFKMDSPDVVRYVHGAKLHTDDQLRLEFNAPKSLYHQGTSELIFQILDAQRTEPFLPVTTQHDPPLEKRPEVLTQIAQGYQAQDESSEQAWLYFEKALTFNPSDATALIGLGRIALARNEFLKALYYFQTASSQAPNQAETWGWFGYGYLKGGSYQWAVELLEKAAALDPQRAEFLIWKAQALEYLNRPREALEAYGRARELIPRRLSLELAYARTLRESGDPRRALEVLEPLRHEFLTYSDIYEEFLPACEAAGDLPLAVRAFEDLVRANPYRSAYWLQLENLYEKTGDKKKAAWAIARGRKIHPYFISRLTLGRHSSSAAV